MSNFTGTLRKLMASTTNTDAYLKDHLQGWRPNHDWRLSRDTEGAVAKGWQPVCTIEGYSLMSRPKPTTPPQEA